MGIIKSNYKAPTFIKGGHLQTIYPYLFRKITGVNYVRERVSTSDDDFIDLDWSKVGSKHIVLLAHGLEGHSGRDYILGMVKYFNQHKVDTISFNFRSCSGEINNLKRFYHHGTTDDLDHVINHVLGQGKYQKLSMIGFSLGGSLVINYLGERKNKLPKEIHRSVVFSTPFDLHSSSFELKNKKLNHIYVYYFMKTLRKKMLLKNKMLDLGYEEELIKRVKDFDDFDELFTAPLHGFKNKFDYYEKVSAKKNLQNIQLPTLLINAQNDPFLAKNCFPIEEAKNNPNISLEIPFEGGHCGFVSFQQSPYYWSEVRAGEFILN